MSCCETTCCCCACTCGQCAPCRARCTLLVTSQPDQDAAQSCVSGTKCTINSLIMTVGNIGGRILDANCKQKTLAVKQKAAVQNAKTAQSTWIVIAVIILAVVILMPGILGGRRG